MSTKIYNGYRLPAMTAVELLNFCNSLRPHIQEEKRRLLIEYFVSNVTYHRDLFLSTQKLEVKEKTTIAYWRTILDAQIQGVKKGVNNGYFDFESNAVFFPQTDKTLMLLYVYRRELKDLLVSLSKAEDYSYQNQSDHFLDISEEAYQARGKDWNSLLGNEAPNKKGLTFVFTDNDYFKETQNLPEQMSAQMLSLDERIERLSKKLTNDYYRQNNSLYKNSEYDAWLTTPEAQDFKDSLTKELKLKLPPTYTLADLLKKSI